jgi:hypothetical protein
VAVRDDAPQLRVQLVGAPGVTFQEPAIGAVTLNDPTPGDGFHTLLFEDPVKVPDLGAHRFWRLRIEILP